LLLGTSQWLTANGRLIRKQGIAPDIAVTLGPDGDLLTPDRVRDLTATELAESGDAQLLTAIETLTGMPVGDQTAQQQKEIVGQ